MHVLRYPILPSYSLLVPHSYFIYVLWCEVSLWEGWHLSHLPTSPHIIRKKNFFIHSQTTALPFRLWKTPALPTHVSLPSSSGTRHGGGGGGGGSIGLASLRFHPITSYVFVHPRGREREREKERERERERERENILSDRSSGWWELFQILALACVFLLVVLPETYLVY